MYSEYSEYSIKTGAPIVMELNIPIINHDGTK